MGRSIPRRAITKIKDRKRLELTASVYAKRANQRLRELESNETIKDPLSSNAYRQIRDFAKDKRAFMSTTKQGQFKFRTSFGKMTREELEEELKELDTFLFEAKTSTVKGAKAHYKKIKDSIANSPSEGKTERVKDFFAEMDDDDFDDFWYYSGIKGLWDMFGSDEAVRIVEESTERGLSMEKINQLVTEAKNKKLTNISEIDEYIKTTFADMVKNV